MEKIKDISTEMRNPQAWWDNHGTHFENYDGIQIVFQNEGE